MQIAKKKKERRRGGGWGGGTTGKETKHRGTATMATAENGEDAEKED